MATENKKVEHGGGEPQVKPAFGKKPIGPEAKTYSDKPAVAKWGQKTNENK